MISLRKKTGILMSCLCSFILISCSKSSTQTEPPIKETALWVSVNSSQPLDAVNVLLYGSLPDLNKEANPILTGITDKEGYVKFKNIPKKYYYIKAIKGCNSNDGRFPIVADMTSVKDGDIKTVGFGISPMGNIKIVNTTVDFYDIVDSTSHSYNATLFDKQTADIKYLPTKDHVFSIQRVTGANPKPRIRYVFAVKCGETTTLNITN